VAEDPGDPFQHNLDWMRVGSASGSEGMEKGMDNDRSAATEELVRHLADPGLMAVIDCCHAQEEKDEEQTHKVEDCNCTTGQEVLGCQTSATSDKDGQEKTI
jgi:hypothetical protein